MRLTVANKRELVELVVNSAYLEKEVKLNEELAKLGLELWDGWYGRYKDRMLALPQEAFRMADGVWVNVYSGSTSRYLRRFWINFPRTAEGFRINMPVFYSEAHNLFDDSELYRRIHSLHSKKEELSVKKRDLTSEIMRVAKPITTTKRLREVWPEGEEWINMIEDPPPPPMIVSAKKLNSILCEEIGEKFCQ